MGLFDRIRGSSTPRSAGSESDAEAARRGALRLIEEGNTIEDAGELAAAMERYEAAVALAPDLARGHVNRGNILLATGNAEAALFAYATALEKDPDYPAAHFNIGNVHAQSGRPDAALTSYRRALTLKPDFAPVEVAMGCALEDLGRVEEAVTCYRRALTIEPRVAETHFNLGGALEKLGRLEDATSSYRNAADLRPDYADAHFNLGHALEMLLRLDEAALRYRRSIEIAPAFAEAHFGLGNVLRALGKPEEGLGCYRRAVGLRPDYAEAHNNIGTVLKEFGRLDEAAASYRRAIEIRPNFAEAHSNLGNVLDELLRSDEAQSSYRRALEIDPGFAPAYHNLLFCLSEQERVDPEALFAEHRRFGEQFEAPLRAKWPRHGNERDPERRLQVGFVSADLRDHAVAHFVEPILAQLAPSAGISLHAYSSHAAEDRVTARLRASASHWHQVAGMSDEMLAGKIIEDGIDILVDLSGHTAGNRLLTFARKPAPVQASWIGYPGTTGLDAMDYYLADRYFLPPGQFDGQFTERLVYLPANAPFLPDDGAPPVNALPAPGPGQVTFGSFNRLSKLSRPAIALWSRLLRELPDARMLLGGMPRDGDHAPLLAWFAAEGVRRDRLILHRRCDVRTYLGLHHQVDICLDTFPYTGGTTTNHALWMGVPTLTIAGLTPPGRQGAAIMGHLGLEAFVAENADDFVEKGLFWARNLAGLAELRAALRGRFEQSPIRHPEVIAAGLERALRIMWQRWCAGLPAESFEVAAEITLDRKGHERLPDGHV